MATRRSSLGGLGDAANIIAEASARQQAQALQVFSLIEDRNQRAIANAQGQQRIDIAQEQLDGSLEKIALDQYTEDARRIAINEGRPFITPQELETEFGLNPAALGGFGHDIGRMMDVPAVTLNSAEMTQLSEFQVLQGDDTDAIESIHNKRAFGPDFNMPDAQVALKRKGGLASLQADLAAAQSRVANGVLEVDLDPVAAESLKAMGLDPESISLGTTSGAELDQALKVVSALQTGARAFQDGSASEVETRNKLKTEMAGIVEPITGTIFNPEERLEPVFKLFDDSFDSPEDLVRLYELAANPTTVDGAVAATLIKGTRPYTFFGNSTFETGIREMTEAIAAVDTSKRGSDQVIENMYASIATMAAMAGEEGQHIPKINEQGEISFGQMAQPDVTQLQMVQESGLAGLFNFFQQGGTVPEILAAAPDEIVRNTLRDQISQMQTINPEFVRLEAQEQRQPIPGTIGSDLTDPLAPPVSGDTIQTNIDTSRPAAQPVDEPDPSEVGPRGVTPSPLPFQPNPTGVNMDSEHRSERVFGRVEEQHGQQVAQDIFEVSAIEDKDARFSQTTEMLQTNLQEEFPEVISVFRAVPGSDEVPLGSGTRVRRGRLKDQRREALATRLGIERPPRSFGRAVAQVTDDLEEVYRASGLPSTMSGKYTQLIESMTELDEVIRELLVTAGANF